MKHLFVIFLFLILQSCSESKISVNADEIAQDSLILDSHIDVPFRLWSQHLEGLEIDDISGSYQWRF